MSGPLLERAPEARRAPHGLFLKSSARSGVRLDLYLTATEGRTQITALGSLAGVKVIRVSSVWRWNRWYSRNNIVAMVTGMGSTSLGRRRLMNLLVEQHKLVPYDVMYQFSTIEVFGRRRDRQKLPTMVLHPSVHAAGELHWMWNERELSRRCEGWLRPRLVMGWFLFRSRRQRRDIGRAALVLALKRRVWPPPRRGLWHRPHPNSDRPEPDRPQKLPSAGTSPSSGRTVENCGAWPDLGSQRA